MEKPIKEDFVKKMQEPFRRLMEKRLASVDVFAPLPWDIENQIEYTDKQYFVPAWPEKKYHFLNMRSENIARKYVYGEHDALTDNQEIKDMVKDIDSYVIDFYNWMQDNYTQVDDGWVKKLGISVPLEVITIEYALQKYNETLEQ